MRSCGLTHRALRLLCGPHSVVRPGDFAPAGQFSVPRPHVGAGRGFGRLLLIPGGYRAISVAFAVVLWILARSNDAGDSERFYWSGALGRIRPLRPEPSGSRLFY